MTSLGTIGSHVPRLSSQEHALNMLRNLVYGDAPHARAVMAWAADEGNPGSGAANLLAALASPLQPGAPSTPGQREQALFAVCNICAGECASRRNAAPRLSAAAAAFTQPSHVLHMLEARWN